MFSLRGIMMRKGKRLSKGDTIGLIAPSSPPADQDVKRAKEELEMLGFSVVVGQSCSEVYGGYLAGAPELRANDIHAMFSSSEVDGVMCIRGGYGSPQLLELLDFQLIKEHPKIFIGFSDITALHIAFQQKAHLATIHGPTVARGITSLPAISRDYLLRAITTASPLGDINNPDGIAIKSLVHGQATGRIIGGNLSLIAATMGTPYEIDTKGKILFLEDVGEEPYRIDRMLTQLALGGKFSDAEGIILGSWHGCDPAKYQNCFTVIDLFHNIITPFGKPTIYNLQSGHGEFNVTLPFGVEATVDAANKQLIIHEAAVE